MHIDYNLEGVFGYTDAYQEDYLFYCSSWKK